MQRLNIHCFRSLLNLQEFLTRNNYIIYSLEELFQTWRFPFNASQLHILYQNQTVIGTQKLAFIPQADSSNLQLSELQSL